jgi:hypothetical protein
MHSFSVHNKHTAVVQPATWIFEPITLSSVSQAIGELWLELSDVPPCVFGVISGESTPLLR